MGTLKAVTISRAPILYTPTLGDPKKITVQPNENRMRSDIFASVNRFKAQSSSEKIGDHNTELKKIL
jgi:hypothetical protein